jgi:hypothetical protein
MGARRIRLAVVTGTSTAVAAAMSVNGLAELFEVHPGIDHAISELA